VKKHLPIPLIVVSCLASLLAAAQHPNFEFIENKGQWDSRVKYIGAIGDFGSFYLDKGGFTVRLHNPADVARASHHPVIGEPAGSSAAARKVGPTPDTSTIRSHVYRVRFEGASDNIEVVPDKLQAEHSNYFIGNDPSKWVTDARIYKAVTYKNVYPGIDIRYYSDAGSLKYDIVVNPGADPSVIAMKYEGAGKLSVRNNQLYVGTSVGDVKELYPYSYQFDKINGKTDISCRYDIKDGNTVRFKLKNFARDVPLIIDPVIEFSTFTGSTADNWGFTATPGPDGSLFAGGIVSNDFGNYPVTTGAVQTGHSTGRNWDMGITRFNSTGTARMYSTYIGGTEDDYPLSLISDPQGNLVIMGRTYSGSGFPKSVLFGAGGGADLVVLKLNATGSAITGCLRIGGTGNDAVNMEDQRGRPPLRRIGTLRFYGDDSRGEVILDGSNNIYVASQSQSNNFYTTTGVFQSTLKGAQDGVILEINPTCTGIIFSSYFGGSADDGVFVMDISPLNGHLYVAGTTFSKDLPQTGSAGVIQPNSTSTANPDGFISELTNDGTAVVRTTYLSSNSGTGGSADAYDAIYGLKFDKFGFPYVMGISEGSWPVVNATYSQAGSHQFISKMQPDLSAFVYSTIFGTSGTLPNISPVAFLVDRCENVYVSGWGANYVASLDGSYQMAGTRGMYTSADANKSQTDGRDFYFFVLQKNATRPLYASFFGQSGGYGEHVDGGTSRYDPQGKIYMAICANCEGNSDPSIPITVPYYVTPNVIGPVNGTGDHGCNLGALKIAFNFAGVGAGVRAFINSVFDTLGCVPLTISFKDTVRTATSYTWDFGDGSPQVNTTQFDVSHTYMAIGDYHVMLIGIDSTTCNERDTAYTTIHVRDNEAFLSFAYAKLAPCESLSYQFTNTSTHSATAKNFTPAAFTWDFGDGTRVTPGVSPVTHSYVAAGTYNVRLELNSDADYCNAPDAAVIQLRVAPLVKAQFETPATGCVPYTAIINNTTLAGQNFFWDFGDGTTSTDINPIHLYTSPGTYTIRLVATDTTTCNKIDSTKMDIVLRSKPTAGFTYSPTTPQQNFPYTFTNTSSADAVRFNWNFGDGENYATASRADVEHQYNKTSTFNACLYATNDAGCTDTVCALLQSIIEPRLDVPNAFTPLGNAPNNIIYVRGFGIGKMSWRIYNRFGNLVFSTGDRRQGWDGKFKGTVQPMDVYAYTLEVEFTDGTRATKKGDITLLR